MSGVAAIFNDNVHDKAGNKVDLKTTCAGKVVGIYFSAHWCPPCRGFTPELAKFYNKHHVAKTFEIIFVSSDQDEEHFKNYFSEMPWLALKFSNRELKVLYWFILFSLFLFNQLFLKATLSDKYQIEGIPTLILLDGNSGEILNENGDPDRVSHVAEDPDGIKFPWKS